MQPSINNNCESPQGEKEHFVEGLCYLPTLEQLAAFFDEAIIIIHLTDGILTQYPKE